MKPEDELTTYIDTLLPEMVKVRVFDLSTIDLPLNHWHVVRSRLLEEGLIIKRVRGQVELTPEGRRVALEGSGGYKLYRQNKVKAQLDKSNTDAVTRWTARTTAYIAIPTLLLAGATFWHTFFRPTSTKDDDNKILPVQVTKKKADIRNQAPSKHSVSIISDTSDYLKNQTNAKPIAEKDSAGNTRTLGGLKRLPVKSNSNRGIPHSTDTHGEQSLLPSR